MHLQLRIQIILLFFAVGFNFLKVNAQSNWFTYQGQASVQGEFYNLRAFNDSIRPRRPDQLLRFIGSGAVGIKGINIPFSFMFTNNQTTVNSPIPTDQNIIDFITDPINSVGLAPQFEFGQIMVGTYVPKFTSFTTGDTRSFGLGIDALFNNWRVAFHAGNTSVPKPEDLFLGLPGVYTRRQFTGKFGWGADDDTHIHIGVMRLNDHLGSVPDTLTMISPQENAVISLNYKWVINENYNIEGEIGRSGLTESSIGEEINTDRLLANLITINATSRLGNAAKIAVQKQGKILSGRLYFDYLTPGFRTLGYPFLQADQLNYRIEPRVNLMEGKLNLAGAIGQRINNVSGLNAARSIQLTGSLNVSYQATERLNISASFFNFGLRNTIRNDTIRVENVSRNFNITPSYTIPATNHTHIFTFAYTLDDFDDQNLITGNENSNNSNTILFSYALNWNNSPLNFSSTIMQFRNNLSFQELTMRSATASVGYQFFDQKMQSSVAFTYTENQVDELDPAKQALTRVRYQYQVIEKLAFQFEGSINLFRFGSEKPGVRFQETLIRTSLTYTFN